MVVIDVEHGVLQAGNRHGCGNEENDTDEVARMRVPRTAGALLFLWKIQKETPIGLCWSGFLFAIVGCLLYYKKSNCLAWSRLRQKSGYFLADEADFCRP